MADAEDPPLPFAKAAIIMIGYQNDYFSDDGILHGVIELSRKAVLARTP